VREDYSGYTDDQNLNTFPGWVHSMAQVKLHGLGTSTPMGSSTATGGSAFAADECYLGCNVTVAAEIRGGGIEVQLANHIWAEGASRTHTCDELQHRRDGGAGGCDDGPNATSDCCDPGDEQDCNSSGGDWDSSSCTCNPHEHDPGSPVMVGQETASTCTCDCPDWYSCTQYICQEITYYYETRCTFDNEVVETWEETPSPICDGGNPCNQSECCSGFAPSRRRFKKPSQPNVEAFFRTPTRR
jgi:hypothetical protein